MDDYDRFENERLEEVWRKTYSSVLYFAAKELQEKAIEMGKSCHYLAFDLPEYAVEDYLKKMNHE